MSEAKRIKALLALASDDLRSAELLVAGVPRQAAYHLQQAVEKVVKALLVREGVDPDRIHQIGRLAHELGAAHPLRAELLKLDRLTVYATAMRYPQPSGRLVAAPSPDRLRKDLKDVLELYASARAYLESDASGEGVDNA